MPGAGRPPLDIDIERIAYLVSLDCSLAEVAANMGCSPDTIERRVTEAGFVDFAVYRDIKRALGQSRIRERLDKISDADPVLCKSLSTLTANIWLSKQRLGYRDRTEQTGPAPVQITYVRVVPQGVIVEYAGGSNVKELGRGEGSDAGAGEALQGSPESVT